jgi:glycosyltransferase involved in cell wall biosynthesis
MTLPFVSICTPTFNRRPFFQVAIQCFKHQTYPADLLEWIIIDDGTDKIEDLIADIDQVRYFKYLNKMKLGEKRNIMNSKCRGDIIVYMDDDDYYPPERVSHAVEMLLKNPEALCAGSSEMHIYFKDINKMYKCGPYGPNHSTAATFAFKKELLKETAFNNDTSIAEERTFLKNYTIPFIQLDSLKTILVFSHIHNSFNKNELLKTPNKYITESERTISDFVKEAEIIQFFIYEIDQALEKYFPGSPALKEDVLSEMQKITDERIYSRLQIENTELREKNKYLEMKVKQLLTMIVNTKKNN